MSEIVQRAPWSETLQRLVATHHHRNWRFVLWEDYDRGQGSMGTTLVITTFGERDAYRDGDRPVNHLMVVPAASYNEQSWRRWLFEQCALVEFHEAMEHFEVDCPVCEGTGMISPVLKGEEWQDLRECSKCEGRGRVKVYPPNHGPGYDPYRLVEYEDDVARRTLFTGEVKDA